MSYFWRNNSIPTKISAMAVFAAMAYLFFENGESFGAWTIFFIGLFLTILFHSMDEKDKEIEALRKNQLLLNNKKEYEHKTDK